ncbi:NUDIX hydrolase [Bacilli bacterium]|nr:NUDIX hydrolase [Bacilli bacterium]
MKKCIVNVNEAEFLSIKKDIFWDGIEKIVVGALIIFDSDRPLVLRRVPNDFMGGFVELPGGHVESGETMTGAVIREVKEETGLSVISIDSIVGTFDYMSDSGKKTRQINFKVTTNGKDVKLSPEEHNAFYIISRTSREFAELNMSKSMRNAIEVAFQLLGNKNER